MQLAEGCSKPDCPDLDLADVRQKIQDSELVVICLGTGRSTQHFISEVLSWKWTSRYQCKENDITQIYL